MLIGMPTDVLWVYWGSARWWSAEPLVIGPVVGLAALWWLGRRRLIERGPSELEQASVSRWRGVAFLVGLAIILLALESPIDYFSQLLFWTHMVQHLLLLVVAAPLIVAGSPWLAIWEAIPESLRSSAISTWHRPWFGATVGRFYSLVRSPAGTFAIFATVVWGWHLPYTYDLTLANGVVHDCEHLSFIVFGVAFWLQIFDSPPFERVLTEGRSVIYLIGAMGVNVVLSAALGLSQHPWYAPYAALSAAQRPGGVSALWDQQFGAGIMWTLGDLPFSFTIGRCVLKWLEPEAPSKVPVGSAL